MPYAIVLWFFLFASCDTSNIFKAGADKSSDKALLEDAKIAIDQEDYVSALELLNKMAGDSNEKHILMASAFLGKANLGVLDIARTTFDKKDGNEGSDSFFDSLNEATIFGTGDVRTARLAALEAAITTLATAPEPGELKLLNLGCVLSGLLALPTASTATKSMTDATDDLAKISQNVVGAGADSSQCPGIEQFEADLATIDRVRASFNEIFATIDRCPILDLSGSNLNAIEASLKKVTANADKGCKAVPKCTAGDVICAALGLGCMQTLLSDTSAKAGDGAIATCEIIQNCLEPGACF